jgi:hypothetical protein
LTDFEKCGMLVEATFNNVRYPYISIHIKGGGDGLMKFLFAKREKACRHCSAVIERGELYIQTSHRNINTGRYFSFSYHYECYIIYFTERIGKDALYYMGRLEPPKKLGRPKKHINPKLINRKKALLRYHRKAGHLDRVTKIQEELDTLMAQ